MLKLKLQYFGHLMRRANSMEKTLGLGKIEDRRRWGRQRMRWLDGITDLLGKSLTKFWVLVINRETCHTAANGSQSVGHNDWNELKRSNWYFVGHWILKLRTNSISHLFEYMEYFLTEDERNLIFLSSLFLEYGKFLRRWEHQSTWPSSWEIYMQVKKKQLELDMEQQTGSK